MPQSVLVALCQLSPELTHDHPSLSTDTDSGSGPALLRRTLPTRRHLSRRLEPKTVPLPAVRGAGSEHRGCPQPRSPSSGVNRSSLVRASEAGLGETPLTLARLRRHRACAHCPHGPRPRPRPANPTTHARPEARPPPPRHAPPGACVLAVPRTAAHAQWRFAGGRFPAAAGPAPPFLLAGGHHGTCGRRGLPSPPPRGCPSASCLCHPPCVSLRPARPWRREKAGRRRWGGRGKAEAASGVLGWERAPRAAVGRAPMAAGRGGGQRVVWPEPARPLLALCGPRGSALLLSACLRPPRGSGTGKK